jgi:ketosteroid isomerase-like protein
VPKRRSHGIDSGGAIVSSHPRAEIQDAIDRFIAANRRAEEVGDWSGLADFYTEDAVYTYAGLAAGGLVDARGRNEIRRQILERDMAPYRGWTFPYEWVAIDGDRVVTRWWNRAPGSRADGTPIECPGMSVLEYAGGGRFKSQFDLFDRLSVKAVAEEWEKVRAGRSR